MCVVCVLCVRVRVCLCVCYVWLGCVFCLRVIVCVYCVSLFARFVHRRLHGYVCDTNSQIDRSPCSTCLGAITFVEYFQ